MYEDDPLKVVKVGFTEVPQLRDQVILLLVEYRDMFAWSPLDMTGVSPSIITHKLHVDPSGTPVKQKQRKFVAEINLVIRDEVNQLLAAKILFEVQFPTWIANPIMIKKIEVEGWRMCIDYSDLNKHCPKDCYHLSNIDKKFEALVGYEIFYFFDLYKGYHHVLMSDEDAAKMTFITDFGTFAYRKIPFGLKNAGATYQRMVDKIFRDHIGQIVEVYVDDIVVKSKEKTTSFDDLKIILGLH